MNDQERKQQDREPPTGSAPPDRPARDQRRSAADKPRSPTPPEGSREPQPGNPGAERSLASGTMKGGPKSDRATSEDVTDALEDDELLSDANDPLQRAHGPRSDSGRAR